MKQLLAVAALSLANFAAHAQSSGRAPAAQSGSQYNNRNVVDTRPNRPQVNTDDGYNKYSQARDRQVNEVRSGRMSVEQAKRNQMNDNAPDKWKARKANN